MKRLLILLATFAPSLAFAQWTNENIIVTNVAQFAEHGLKLTYTPLAEGGIHLRAEHEKFKGEKLNVQSFLLKERNLDCTKQLLMPVGTGGTHSNILFHSSVAHFTGDAFISLNRTEHPNLIILRLWLKSGSSKRFLFWADTLKEEEKRHPTTKSTVPSKARKRPSLVP